MNVATRALHPVQWVAAISLTLFSIVGVASLMGWLPKAQSAARPETVAAPLSAPVPVASAASTTPQPASAPSPEIVKKASAPKPVQTARHEKPAPVAAVEIAPTPPAVCNDCGRIESVRRIEHEGQGSGIGAVAGGVVGGALANNVGNGSGKAVATLAGLIGGAMLGNHIEKQQKKTVNYETVVRYEDGESQSFSSTYEPTWQIGERVRVENGAIRPRADTI